MSDRWNRSRFLVGLPIFLCAAALPGHAQSVSGPECTYDRCALRIEDGQIRRGAVSEPVGKLGALGGGTQLLLAGPDSAAHYARLFTKTRRRGLAIGLPGALVLATVQVLGHVSPGWDASDTASWIGAAAAPLAIYSIDAGYTYDRVAVRAGHRSVWWYNRQFADQGPAGSGMPSLWPERNAPGRLILGGGALGATLGYAVGDNAEGAFFGSTIGAVAGFFATAWLRRW